MSQRDSSHVNRSLPFWHYHGSQLNLLSAVSVHDLNCRAVWRDSECNIWAVVRLNRQQMNCVSFTRLCTIIGYSRSNSSLRDSNHCNRHSSKEMEIFIEKWDTSGMCTRRAVDMWKLNIATSSDVRLVNELLCWLGSLKRISWTDSHTAWTDKICLI